MVEPKIPWFSFQPDNVLTEVQEQQLRPGHSFKDGFSGSRLNVKVALCFIVFLPQFVVKARFQLAANGILIRVVVALVEPLIIIAVFGAFASARRSRKPADRVDRAFGPVFLALGLALL
jgi:threonine/homoserine/homoserine lactone efflux protein